MKKFHLALLGTRGIPARYGGFETFAEEISRFLVERGHHVTVYGRHKLGQTAPSLPDVNGVHVRSTATVYHKYLETPLAALSSFLDLFRCQYDAVLLCNAAAAPFAFLIKLRGLPLLINVDGIERERAKWNSLGRLWYRLGEQCAVWFADRVVSDAQVIARYYRETYGVESEVITYGATPKPLTPGPVLEQFKLRAKEYILYVSRLEPENNALGVIQAYAALKQEPRMPLVVVGDAPYATEYKQRLRQAAEGKNVVFTGFQFAEAYRELRSNCYCYVQATEVGGTHPALVEGMAYGNCVIANGTPENREVLGDAGLFYSKNDFSQLSSLFAQLLGDPEAVKSWGLKAAERAQAQYSWPVITDQYERLLSSLLT